MIESGNLFANVPTDLRDEEISTLRFCRLWGVR